MAYGWKVYLTRIALVLNFLGALSVFFSLEIIPSDLFTGPKLLNGNPIAIILANRIWLRTAGWILIGIGFAIQFISTFFKNSN